MNNLLFTLETCFTIIGLALVTIFRHRRYVDYDRSSLPDMRRLLDSGIGFIILSLILKLINLLS